MDATIRAEYKNIPLEQLKEHEALLPCIQTERMVVWATSEHSEQSSHLWKLMLHAGDDLKNSGPWILEVYKESWIFLYTNCMSIFVKILFFNHVI